MTGTTHISCAIRIAKVVRPCSLASSPRSASVPMTMAVDDIAKARPISVAASQGAPSSSTRYSARAAAVTSICAEPNPKISRRMAQTFPGRSSRPTVNMNSTTPSSAMLCNSSTACTGTGPGVCGPISTPATMKPRIDPKPRRSNSATQSAVAARMMTMASRMAESSMVSSCLSYCSNASTPGTVPTAPPQAPGRSLAPGPRASTRTRARNGRWSAPVVRSD